MSPLPGLSVLWLQPGNGCGIPKKDKNIVDLKTLLRLYWKGIALATVLIVVEKTAWILEPSVFGGVIDAMIAKQSTPPQGSIVIPLMLWIGLFCINSGVGAYRRYRDEKIFLGIYNDIVAGIARRVQKGQVEPARAAARAELSREVINFYQYRIPDTIEQAIDIIGAITALTLFDWRLGATCAAILVPTFFMGRMYNKKVSFFQQQIHDQQEDVFHVYQHRNIDDINTYYRDLAGWKQKIANWGAINFGVLRVFLLGIFLVILFVAIDLDDFTTGNIYSIGAYIWTFVTSSEYLPEQLESMTSVKDINKRLQAELE
jgi:ABC-type multidrug transport system fused ATPase/permease subunit